MIHYHGGRFEIQYCFPTVKMNSMHKTLAAKVMLTLLAIITLFHTLVLIGIIPYTIVWAGKLKTVEEMYVFESISITINLFLAAVILQRFRFINALVKDHILDIILWVFVAIFAINTIGNLFSKSTIELILGTSITFVSAVLCWVMARKGN
jgi:hypothetical protein